MTVSKRRRAVLDLMQELGVAQHTLTVSRGTHLRLEMVHGGRKLTYFMSATPSDHREWQNTRAGVRRLLRTAEGSSRRTSSSSPRHDPISAT